ncbi:serine protease family protein [Flavisericum labens]|uniref:hypothetical protein n=1 Tax=Flavisericum labens TaxID=3377112 RepID=UPI00387A8CEF
MSKSKNPRKVNINKVSYCTVSISMYLEETKQKLASATAFIYEYGNKYYLITNWHNVTGLNPLTREPISIHGGVPNVLVLSLLIKKKPYLSWSNFSIYLYDNNDESDWLIHPEFGEKVDVVAIELDIGENLNAILTPINKIEFNDFDLEIADDIFILGYPYNLDGGGKFPIWKRGSVATEPDLDMDKLPKIFVDTASKRGMSGAPVIYRRTGIHGAHGRIIPKGAIIGTIEGFVGIYSGRIVGKDDFDAQLGIVWKKQVIEEIIVGNKKDNHKF